MVETADLINVVNKHTLRNVQLNDVYIGRGSALGNPYKIKPHGPYERGETLGLYETHLRAAIAAREPGVMALLEQIADEVMNARSVRLVCFCAPRACHGDVIKKIVCEAIDRG